MSQNSNTAPNNAVGSINSIALSTNNKNALDLSHQKIKASYSSDKATESEKTTGLVNENPKDNDVEPEISDEELLQMALALEKQEEQKQNVVKI